MNKFNFELENVLKIRRQFEDKAKNELSVQIKKLNEKIEELQKENASKNHCIEKLKEAQTGNVNIIEIKNYSAYIKHLEGHINSLNEAVNEQKNVVDKYRKRLLDISKKKKVLEKLKEKKLITFLEEQKKHEEKLSDEITSYKFFKK